jgi:hypothetical protein
MIVVYSITAADGRFAIDWRNERPIAQNAVAGNDGQVNEPRVFIDVETPDAYAGRDGTLAQVMKGVDGVVQFLMVALCFYTEAVSRKKCISALTLKTVKPNR